MTASPAHPPNPSERPEQAFGFLWTGRWWIASVALLGALAGAAYAESRGTLWRARSVVQVERPAPLGFGADAALDRELPRNFAAAQAELLRATPVLLAALDEGGLRGSEAFGDATNELAWLKRHLAVDVGNQNDLITVTLDSPLRERACEVVNAVVDAYLEYSASSRRASTSDTLEHLATELDRYEAELQGHQQALVDFMQANPGVRLQADVNVAADRLRLLHEAMTEAELEAMDARASWQAASRLAGMPELLRQVPLVEARDNLIAPRGASEDARQLGELRAMRLEVLARTTADLTSRYRALQADRQRLLARVTPEHPAVARIDRDLELLREQASAGNPTADLDRTIESLEARAQAGEAEFAAAYVAALETRYLGVLERREQLAAEVAAQEQEILASESRTAEYRMLEQRLERSRKIADLLYQRISEIDIVKQLGESRTSATRATVFEYATPESAVVASSKRAVLAIAVFLGLLLGAVVAWLRSLVDQRLRTAEDLAALAPVLGVVPTVDVGRDGVLATWSRRPEFAEAMHALRMALSQGERGGGGRVVQVASAEAADGKSLIAAGLAIAYARAGQRTLLIDTDFHGPEQHRLFGMSDATGLVQLLEHGRLDLAALRTSLDGLYVLPCGPVPAALDELLAGRRLGVTLRELTRRFDRVILDSAPLLGGNEARVMAALADETLLVARAGRTTRRMLRLATTSMASVGGRFAGAVLNRAPRGSLQHVSSRVTPDDDADPVRGEMVLVK